MPFGIIIKGLGLGIFLGLFWQGLDKGFELDFALGYPDLGQIDLGLT
jgi:hypothetical protein